MKYNADLYKLIKSLTKSEKRYFKIYSAQHTKNKSNNYILLFDAIDQQSDYNEEKLRRKFRNHTFGKNLAKTKYLLYELIEKMLLQLRKGKDIGSKIRLLFDAVEFHYSKSLYDQAFTSLQKAKKLALFFEHHSFWIEALDWEKKLFGYAKKMDADYSLKSINKEYRMAKSLLTHEINATILLQEVRHLAESSCNSPMNELVFELEILFKKRLITKNKAKTFLSKLYTHEILVLRAMACRNLNLAFLHLNESYEMWDNYEEKIAIFPHEFIHFCMTYMNCCTNATRKGIYYDEIVERLLKLDKLVNIDRDKIFFLVTMHDFILNLVNNNQEVCAVQVFTIKDLIKEHIGKLNFKDSVNLYYHIGVFYFIKGEYRKTLNWIEKIQKSGGKDVCPNLNGYCHLLGLVAKYEEQDFFQIESELLKTYQFFDSKESVQPVENLILMYIGRLINANLFDEKMTVFTQFFNSLQNINDGNLTYKTTTNTAICQWVEGKMLNKNIPLLN